MGTSIDKAYARFYERAMMPLWENVVRKRPTLKFLERVETSQWDAPEQLQAQQLDSLKRLLTRAGREVPYYRELFEKIRFDPRDMRSAADIQAVPVLTKDIIRARYRELLNPAFVGQNIKKGTSGSTGQPLAFEYSQESESWRQAIRIRAYKWSGWRPGLPTFHYWAVGTEIPHGLRGGKIRLDRGLRRELYFDSMRQRPSDMLAAVEQLRRLRPAAVVCYVQSCAQWARFIVDRGLRDWEDIPVICGAEPVFPADREAIARAFGPHIFETYGSRETMLIAAECDHRDGLHLSEENMFVETLDSSGSWTANELAGDIVVTDLFNDAMPFIRYVNGDVGALEARKRCACGRGLRKIRRIEGRRADTLVGPDGAPIPGIIFHAIFGNAQKDVVRQFQAVQKRDKKVVLKYVRGTEFSEERFAHFVRRFADYLHGLPFSVEEVPSIAPQPNGKFKTVLTEQ